MGSSNRRSSPREESFHENYQKWEKCAQCGEKRRGGDKGNQLSAGGTEKRSGELSIIERAGGIPGAKTQKGISKRMRDL